mgnify:CR=1 FL=1
MAAVVSPRSAQQGAAATTLGADLEATDHMPDAPRRTTLRRRAADELRTCPLYTSDAADDLPCDARGRPRPI